MRLVVADDSMLLREGLARLLADAGFDVVERPRTPVFCAASSSPARTWRLSTSRCRRRTRTRGSQPRRRSARRIRRSACSCSRYLESRYAMRLLEEAPDKVGYLLKDRVSDIAVLADALKRIDEGECVIDPTIVSRLLKRPREQGPFDELTQREREVLGLMAEGRSNGAICQTLVPQPEDGRGERAADLPKARAAAVARRPPPRPRGSQVPACRATGGLTVDRRIRAIPRRRHSVQEHSPRDEGPVSATACAA